MRTKIEVTQECIDKGKPRKCEWCPIALAVKKITAKVMSVGATNVQISNRMFELPQKATRFIEDFDSGGEVKPFSFVIDIPKKYLKQ